MQHSLQSTTTLTIAKKSSFCFLETYGMAFYSFLIKSPFRTSAKKLIKRKMAYCMIVVCAFLMRNTAQAQTYTSYQTINVTADGRYQFLVKGGAGTGKLNGDLRDPNAVSVNGNWGGTGATITADFYLLTGDIVYVIPGNAAQYDHAPVGGGGGGSAVIVNRAGNFHLLVVAGGGGGGGWTEIGLGGSITNYNGTQTAAGGTGIIAGGGGGGGVGAGFGGGSGNNTAGGSPGIIANHVAASGGSAVNGSNGASGFGGGGGGGVANKFPNTPGGGGGGGGYIGGNGGPTGTSAAGGTSYVNNTEVGFSALFMSAVAGVDGGNTAYSGNAGFVVVTLLPPLTQPQTINPVANVSKTYGDADFAPGGTSTSGLTLTYSSADNSIAEAYQDAADANKWKIKIKKSGTVAITASQPGDTNFDPAIPVVFDLNIAKATLAVTAVAKTKIFGEADPALTYTVSGLLGIDVVTGTLSRVTGEDVGVYTINQGDVAAGLNYTISYTAANLTITKAPITGITFSTNSFVYDGTAKALAITGTLPTGASVSYSNNAKTAAGNYQVTATINGGSNYQDQSLTADLTIIKAMLTITANNAAVCQGSNLPTFTLSYTGFVAGDSPQSLTTLPKVSTTASSSSAVGNYVLIAKDAIANNYEISYVNGSLTINALPVVAITSNKGNSISKGETLQLTATGGTSYVWSGGNGIISGQNTAVLTIRPEKTGVYTVTATNANGCSSQQQFELTVREDFAAVQATNLLTPNGDGINDVWVVDNIDFYPNNEVIIFDKAGRVLFKQKGYKNTWDGTVKASKLAEDTYYYIIDFGTGKLKQKGFITLVRE